MFSNKAKESMSKTINVQAQSIIDLTRELKEVKTELNEVKIIRRNTESKNFILEHLVKKIQTELENNQYNNLENFRNKIKSILEEATKQL